MSTTPATTPVQAIQEQTQKQVQAVQDQVQKQVQTTQKQVQDQVQKVTEVSKNVAGVYKKFNDINSQLVSGLLRQQLDLFNIYTESSLAYVQALASVKQPQELMNLQSKAVQDLNKSVLGNVRNTYEILNDSKTQFTAWAEESFKQISKDVKDVAKDATPVVAKAA
ncbi:MAG: phasin family protein [Thiotrichaceae bacterium]|nr:phasin family protein [Thiotrichaceae bacterium]